MKLSNLLIPGKAVRASELRRFGWLFAGFAAGIFGLILPWLLDRPMPHWPLWLGGTVFILATVLPIAIKPLYRAWMVFGGLAGWINTRIILWLLFYVLIMPIGLFMRLINKDPLKRKLDPGAESYRVVSQVQEPEHMEKPF